MLETKPASEKIIMVGVSLPTVKRAEVDEGLDELAALVDTAGAVVLDRMVQDRTRLHPATYIGSGKVQELMALAEHLDADTLVFDDELSPAQVRNLERETKKKILDRSGVILDIFALRAQSYEAKTQVELAQLQYLLPRLTRAWTHLSRQKGGGGIMMRGEGETQLETDKRLIRTKIARLKERLLKVERQRQTRRQSREEHFKVALVGYTNAGKSTLMKALSQADVLIEDRLFATLDPTVRLVTLSSQREFVLTDTVGFIQKLPHDLVASFKSTLEESLEADLLLHVIDASHPNVDKHIETVQAVLGELNVLSKPTIYVFNKCDRLDDDALPSLRQDYSPAIAISAMTGQGIDQLLSAIGSQLDRGITEAEITFPIQDYHRYRNLYGLAEILEEHFEGDTARLRYRATLENAARIKKLSEVGADLESLMAE